MAITKQAAKVLLVRGNARRVARLANVTPATISRILSGKTPNPGIETVRKIEAAIAALNSERGRRPDGKPFPGKGKRIPGGGR